MQSKYHLSLHTGNLKQKPTYQEKFVMRTQKARFMFVLAVIVMLAAFPFSVSADHA